MTDRADEIALVVDGGYMMDSNDQEKLAAEIRAYGDEREQAVLERVDRKLVRLPMGRKYCIRCESYDHECGCDPSVIERKRQELRDAIRALKEKP